MAEDTDNVLETLLGICEEIVTDLMPMAADELFGVHVDIYYPVEVDPLYSIADKILYNDTPDMTGRYIVLGIWSSEKYASDATVDVYTQQDAYIIAPRTVVVPINSKAIVKITTDRIYPFRVDSEQAFYGNNLVVFKRIKLSPMEINPLKDYDNLAQESVLL